jgi:hypothetical protein
MGHYDPPERPRISSPENKIDLSLGEQLDLELALDIGQVHKRDRVYHHDFPNVTRRDCDGDMKVVATTGLEIVSECKTCGMGIRTTLDNCYVTK